MKRGTAMSAINFDSLKYFEKLKEAGVDEKQAKVQIDIMQEVVTQQSESMLKGVSTKEDIYLLKEEVFAIKSDVLLAKEELRKEMQQMKTSLLKWQLGIGFAIIAIMARGFNWIGF